jgi:hypothetical protein
VANGCIKIISHGNINEQTAIVAHNVYNTGAENVTTENCSFPKTDLPDLSVTIEIVGTIKKLCH